MCNVQGDSTGSWATRGWILALHCVLGISARHLCADVPPGVVHLADADCGRGATRVRPIFPPAPRLWPPDPRKGAETTTAAAALSFVEAVVATFFAGVATGAAGAACRTCASFSTHLSPTTLSSKCRTRRPYCVYARQMHNIIHIRRGCLEVSVACSAIVIVFRKADLHWR